MDIPEKPGRKVTTVVLEPETRVRVETYRLRTGRTFSGAVNWLVKQQLDLEEQTNAAS